jgi:hypothetical protein
MFNVECSMEGKGPRDERKDRWTRDAERVKSEK